MKVVVTRKLPVDARALLCPHFDSVHIWRKRQAPSPRELIGFAKNAEVIICTVDDPFDKETIKALSQLKMLITYSVGTNHIDVDFLKRKGIHLFSTPEVLTRATAELTWALILAAARHMIPAARMVRTGQFKGYEPTLFLGKELYAKTLGIIGMGNIGKAVAQRGKGFGMKVIYSGRNRGWPMRKLLQAADVVSLHCPLNEQTRHLISTKELACMKNDAILVNTSRGPVIDEKALARHLKKNKAFVAALDVYEREPKIIGNLHKLPNAICLPHIGSATHEARGKIASMCIDKAIAFARGAK